MKKLVTFVLAAVTTLAMTCTAFAAPSPATVGSVSTTGATATDANGKAITVTVTTTTQTPSADVVKAAGVANAELIGAVDISLPEGTTFPATVTVKVAGVKADTKLVVLHYVNGQWQKETATCGNGTVTISGLTSCSPFAFVADKTTLATTTGSSANNGTTGSAASNGTTSPKTGETAAMPIAALVCALAMAGVVLVSKKRRA